MSPDIETFLKFLDDEDKEKAVNYILEKLNKKEISVVQAYSDYLDPALNVPFCQEGDEACIWKEHMRTSIVRTIVENCYPYILKELKDKNIPKVGKKVVIASPSDEYHDIGSRMVADFFTLAGFDVIFIGANTPRDEIGSAIQHYNAEYLAMSVTNYYHLVEAGKIIANLREKYTFSGKIIVGGNAFYTNPEAYRKIGADLMLKDFNDIKQLAEGK